MSKADTTTPKHEDAFTAWKSSVTRFYSDLERSIPQYQQAFTNLYQENVKAWNNIATSVIDMQREFASKSGIISNLPETTSKVFHEANEKLDRAISVQHKISLATINANKQNIQAWNENADAFGNLNKGILNSWISTINPK